MDRGTIHDLVQWIVDLERQNAALRAENAELKARVQAAERGE